MLDLRFALTPGRVRISCDLSRSASLHALRARLASSVSLTNVAFEVDLDDLLVNLAELGRWPSDETDVTWQTELRRLVEGNAADAQFAHASLLGGPQREGSVVHGENWIGRLTSFQQRDLSRLLQLNHGANFSVPGAGKTRVGLAYFDTRFSGGDISRALVVCPKSAFESWRTEAQLCYTASGPSIRVMDGPSPPVADIVLVNYERLPDARSALSQWLVERPTLLVLDEAHRMKRGPSGAWGAACLAMGPLAKRRLILTGTPAPNGAADLENLLSFVWPGQGRATVSAALATGTLLEASRKLRPLYVRTTKAELGLPPVTVTERRLELTPLHRRLYDALLGQVSSAATRGESDLEALGRVLLYLLMAATTPALLALGSSRHEPLAYRVPPLEPHPDSSLGELMRDLPHFELSPKYQEVLAIVTANAAAGRKTLVWSTFVRNLKSLGSLLARFNPAVVHGGSTDREALIHAFRTDPSCWVLLSNPATLGEGVSLHHECHDAVYVDRDFAAGRYLQSVDRIHRLGLSLTAETRVTILVSNRTIDELVGVRLASKLDFMGRVLDDPAVLELADLNEEPTISAGMDMADVAALLGHLRSYAPPA